MDKSKRKVKIVNALDFPEASLVEWPEERLLLPQFISGYTDPDLPEPPKIDPSPEIDPAVFDGTDIWEEIAKHLTPREYQIFEMRYRHQYRITDISEIADINAGAVHRHIKTSIKKLRKSFDSPPE